MDEKEVKVPKKYGPPKQAEVADLGTLDEAVKTLGLIGKDAMVAQIDSHVETSKQNGLGPGKIIFSSSDMDTLTIGPKVNIPTVEDCIGVINQVIDELQSMVRTDQIILAVGKLKGAIIRLRS